MIDIATATTTIRPASPSEPASRPPGAPELARQQGVNPVDYLRSRGFIADITDEDGLRAAFDRGPVTLYQGFDPTGPSLHAGHMVGIMMLATLQRMGHRPIALGGGGTAMVGDPTGRTSAREQIGLHDLDRNLTGISAQLARYLDFEGNRFAGGNPSAALLNNADWLLKLQYIPFLRDIGRHFSVNEMLAAETYKTRLESTGLNFVEFNYRLVQAYDFLHLFRTEGCVLQMGGSDQWGNIVAGVDLIRRAEGERAFAFVSPLVTTATGEKMGKTGSGVRAWLDPERFSPYDYYQFWINIEDVLVGDYLRKFTFLPNERIDDLTSVPGEALRDAKAVLAFEATALAHGAEAAEAAVSASRALFSGGSTVTATDESLPTTEIVKSDLDGELTLADAFVRAGLTRSRGEARRLAGQGGLSIDDRKVEDVDIPLRDALDSADAVLLRAGKKRYMRLVVGDRS